MKNSASRTGAGSSVDTTTNVVRWSASVRVDGPGPLHEAVVHGLEQHEELGDVLPGTASRGCGRPPGRRASTPACHPAPGRHGEPAQQPAAEEVGHALGGVEEVEGVAGRRRVDDDQVVAARGVELVEPLHGDVVVALHEAAGDVVVERVGEDGVAGGGVGGVAAHEVVPRLLGVEHGGPQLAPGLGDAGGGERLGRDLRLHVAEALQAEGVGQPPGRVDGEHQHLAAELGGGHGRGRRRGRGLAHPARAAADDDLLGRQQLLERGRALGRPGVLTGRPPSVAQLRAEGLGDLARGPHAVAALEQLGHVQERRPGGSAVAQRVEVLGPRAAQRTASSAASSTGSTTGRRPPAARDSGRQCLVRGLAQPLEDLLLAARRTARAAPG